jgi:hypothetical protein
MTYNQWCEYAQFGMTCEYDNQILNFVEHYTNAKHQQFLDQLENDTTNREVQGVANFWQERGQILPADGIRSDATNNIYQRHTFQEVYLASLPWS